MKFAALQISSPIVTNAEVAQILVLREAKESLKRRFELIEQSLDEAEAIVIAKLDAGALLDGCAHQVEIKISERRYPAWRDHFVNLAGKDLADQVLKDTPAKVYRHLMVK
jgi:hypothetical protein